jgi:hypothetical protein
MTRQQKSAKSLGESFYNEVAEWIFEQGDRVKSDPDAEQFVTEVVDITRGLAHGLALIVKCAPQGKPRDMLIDKALAVVRAARNWTGNEEPEVEP